MNDPIFLAVIKYVEVAQAEFSHGNKVVADENLDAAILLLGDRYVSEGFIDDTPVKLALARAKRKAGEFGVSIGLKESVVRSRLEMYSAKLGCKS